MNYFFCRLNLVRSLVLGRNAASMCTGIVIVTNIYVNVTSVNAEARRHEQLKAICTMTSRDSPALKLWFLCWHMLSSLLASNESVPTNFSINCLYFDFKYIDLSVLSLIKRLRTNEPIITTRLTIFFYSVQLNLLNKTQILL